MKSFSERRIAILGRGIAGLALAYRLLQKGLQPTIFGAHADSASRCAQGVVSNKGLLFFESPLFAAKLTSLSHVQKWLDELERVSGQSISRSFEGISEPYWDAEDFQSLIARIYRRHFLGCHRTENRAYDRHQAWPFLSKEPKGYLFYPADGWFDVDEALNALAEFSRQNGAVTFERQVLAIAPAGDGSLHLCDSSGEGHYFDQVVLATGAATPDILKSLLSHLPKMFLIGGQTLDLNLPYSSDSALLQVRKTMSAIWWKSQLRIGASSWKGMAINPLALEEDRNQLLMKAGGCFGWDPQSLPVESITQRIGTRLRFADRMPGVGSIPFAPWQEKIFLCTGFYKNGLQLADLCAQDLVALLQGEAESVRYPAFSPSRFFSN